MHLSSWPRLTLFGAIALLAFAAAQLMTPSMGLANGRAPVPRLDWRTCGEPFECATAEVPLDHRHPRDRTIELALVRVPATDREHRIGSVFVNPGGPGLSGVQFVRDTAPAVAPILGRRFDIVGVDTRGSGASRPAFDCDVDPEGPGSTPSRSCGPTRTTPARSSPGPGATSGAAWPATATWWGT